MTSKARIELPTDYARDMLGVMDEYGVLEYGEVYFQYSADIKEPRQNVIAHDGKTVCLIHCTNSRFHSFMISIVATFDVM